MSNPLSDSTGKYHPPSDLSLYKSELLEYLDKMIDYWGEMGGTGGDGKDKCSHFIKAFKIVKIHISPRSVSK